MPNSTRICRGRAVRDWIGCSCGQCRQVKFFAERIDGESERIHERCLLGPGGCRPLVAPETLDRAYSRHHPTRRPATTQSNEHKQTCGETSEEARAERPSRPDNLALGEVENRPGREQLEVILGAGVIDGDVGSADHCEMIALDHDRRILVDPQA